MNAFSDLLGNIRDELPKVLGLGTLTLVLVVDLLFMMLQVYPAVRLHSELASQLADAGQALNAPAGDAQIETALKAKLAKMQTTLEQQTGTFLPESEVSVIVNHLYNYADENGVQITKVEAAGTTGPATAKSVGHDVQSFQVVVSGPTVQLVHFVARLKEASLPAVVINQLVIQAGKKPQDASTLTLNLLLYTSSYAIVQVSGTPAP